MNLGQHPKRHEVREPLHWAHCKCSVLAEELSVESHEVDFINDISTRLHDAMVLYDGDAEGDPIINQSAEHADQVWAEVKHAVEAQMKEGGCEWLAALAESNAPICGTPFTKKLHPNWAQYYYMASLAMTTCVVVLDEAWHSSDFCKGEWHLFSRKRGLRSGFELGSRARARVRAILRICLWVLPCDVAYSVGLRWKLSWQLKGSLARGMSLHTTSRCSILLSTEL